MTTQPSIGKHNVYRLRLTSLALLLTTLLGLGLTKSALAATIVISDQASCEAVGGVWNSSPEYCGGSMTVKAGDTVILQAFPSFASVTNNGILSNQSSGYFYMGALTNNAGATMSSYVFNISGTGLNYGTITTSGFRAQFANLYISAPFTNASTGVIVLPGNALMRLGADLNNQGTILLGCDAEINYSGHTISGNPPLSPDCTGPTANPSQSPSASASGWTDSDVTVNWRWRDNTGGSGLDTAHCTTSSKSSGEGAQTLTATCQDRVGNVGTANYTVKVDKTGPVANPTQSPAANAAGWNNTNVTVSWNWTDGGSGLEPGLCETTSSSSQSNGTQTLTASCFDQVGHFTSASYTVKVDRAWPQILANVSPSPSGQSWYASAVTISFTCQEQGTGSGLATNTVGGNATFSSEGSYPAVTNTGTCTDNAGNVATAVTVGPFKLDLTKPTISAAATTAPNANGWYNSDVTVHFTCTDALSGIALCPGDEVLSSEGAAVSSTAQTSIDRAIHYSDPSNVVIVKLDKTAPVVTVTGVSNGATYAAGSVPTVGCTTRDALSGVATQATLSTSGGTPTGPNGAVAVTATCSGASDLAGNSSAPTSVSYMVNALINSSVSQQSVSAVYNATPQSCPSSGGSLPQQAITPIFRNTTSATFSGLFFRVKTLEYTTVQSGQPVLCNATSGNGGVGATLTIPNSSLPGGNSQFNPGEDLVPTFQIGLPVRAQFRIFVDLYAVGTAAAAADTAQAGEYLGSFAYTFDGNELLTDAAHQLFLPLITR